MHTSTAENRHVDITNRIKNAVAAFRKTNSVSGPDPNAFLRYGSKRMPSTWSTPEINDEDFYTGYGFAVVNKRANRSVVLGKKFLFTEAKEDIVKEANDQKKSVVHPYLDLIRSSIDFAERDFWYDISTYLDLEGIYYLMAVRTVAQGGRVGNIQKFSLLNPYWVKPIVNSKGELGGYVESNPTMGQRDIPKEMIITVKLLNPFNPNRPYSLADAARDSQFTLKQANDFARESIDGNLNAPGILSSAIELPDDQFDNFVARIKGHNRGEPLFGNGAGTVAWTDMQTDLDKAALDKINSINRDVLLAISGLSKTGVGVEESGTGREVSRTQKDDFTENAIMPQIENIIDALNLDYRRFYPDQWQANNYAIALDNPLETSHDAEKVDVEIRDSQFTLFQTLVNKGYGNDIASKFAKGMIDITDLGEPDNPPTPTVPLNPDGTPVTPPTPPNPADPTPPVPPVPPAKTKKPKNTATEVYEGYPVPLLQYLTDFENQVNSLSEKSSELHLVEDTDKVRITDIEDRDGVLIGVIDENSYVKLGSFNENADKPAILETLNKRYHNQLIAVRNKREFSEDFYTRIAELSIPAPTHTHALENQGQLDQSTASLLQSVKASENALLQSYLGQISEGEVAPGGSLESYINGLSLPFAVWFTVMFPVYASQRARETAQSLDVRDVPVTTITEGVKAQINDFARKEAESHMNTIKGDLDNALAIIKTMTSDPEEIKRMLQVAFLDIQKRRAPLIAQNASGRIFALSQYEADLQLLTRHDLLKRAFKQLFSSTGDPCSICAYIIVQTNAKPIPFTQEFVSLGDTIEAGGLKMDFNYEQIIAGNVHPHCHCYYKIIIKTEEKNSAELEQEKLEKQTQTISDIVSAQISPLLEKIDSEKGASEETQKTLTELSTRLDEQINVVESKLDELDKRTREARKLKEELLEANELKIKLSEAEDYARQLESIIDGQS